MNIERKRFFDVIRPLFPKGLRQIASRWNGISSLTWEQKYQDQTPITQFADVLATVFHETGATMRPIHEFGDRAYFMRMYDKTGSRRRSPQRLVTRKRVMARCSPGAGIRS